MEAPAVMVALAAAARKDLVATLLVALERLVKEITAVLLKFIVARILVVAAAAQARLAAPFRQQKLVVLAEMDQPLLTGKHMRVAAVAVASPRQLLRVVPAVAEQVARLASTPLMAPQIPEAAGVATAT